MRLENISAVADVRPGCCVPPLAAFFALWILLFPAGYGLAADGYGAAATGGAGGTAVTVTTSAQLIQYAGATTPHIITVSGTINVTGGSGGDGKSVKVKANKTIQGLDPSAKVIGCLDLGGANNVVIQNLNVTHPWIQDPVTGEYTGGGDGITVFGSTNIFITHCTLYDCADGGIDITEAADFITVSWCKFFYTSPALPHRFPMIVGNTNPTSGPDYRVTLHHNWFAENCDQRMPTGSHSTAHIYNNYFSGTGNSYCTNGREGTEFLVENNYYSGVKNPCYKQNGGKMFLAGNLFISCTGHPGGYDSTVGAVTPNDIVVLPSYAYTLDPAANVPAIVMAGAGVPQVTIVPGTSAFLAETGLPANNAVDSGETVTVQLALKNTGAAPTANLQATLLATGGVTLPSGPQSYGALPPGGGEVARSFTFTASGSCGGAITATLQLQDGNNSLGTVTFNFSLGVLTQSFAEHFDSVTAPALPTGWTTTSTGAQSTWKTSIAAADTTPNAAFSPNPASTGVNELISPVITAASPPGRLTFRHRYDLEPQWDGGVIEIKIGAGAFTDIVTAGGVFVTGVYPATLYYSTNPLAGRPAWTGNSSGFVTTSIDLPSAAAGQSFQLRWRCGADSIIGGAGWHVDGVSIATSVCAETAADLVVTSEAEPEPALGGHNLACAITVRNEGPAGAAGVVVTDTLPANATVVSATASQGSVTSSGGTMTGSVGSLAAGASATISLVVKLPPSFEGSVTNAVSVSSNQQDPAPGNNSASVVTSVLADTDTDGMPDTFETANGLNPDDPSDASGDSDGDGASNLDEWRAGTSPADPGSVLRITGMIQDSAGMHITFSTVSGKQYRVDYCNTLAPPNWQKLADGIAGTGGPVVVVDPISNLPPTRFYRVQVK